METLWPPIAAVLLLTVAAYVQVRISAFTQGATKTVLVRLLLLLVGIAFGFTVARAAVDDSTVPAFLIGFGLVHVPAALVLLFKKWRGERRS